MVDRRQEARERTYYRLDVLGKGGHLVGCMVDLSQGGMRVRRIAEEDFAQLENLTIELPRWLDLGRELQVKGRFVWYRETPDGMEGGFAFDGLSRKTESRLTQLIERIDQAAREDGLVQRDRVGLVSQP